MRPFIDGQSKAKAYRRIRAAEWYVVSARKGVC
jgi:hypothetical protein